MKIIQLLAFSVSVLLALSLAGASDSSLRVLNREGKDEEAGKESARDLGVWRWFYRPVERPDIVDTAIDSGLSTLVDLVVAAGLVDVLRGDGPFTVFAPTNEAFAAVPAATLAAIQANVTLLQEVLTYHVLPYELRTFGNTWRGGRNQTTVNTANVTTTRYRAGRRGPLVKKVNNARVLISDVTTRNGVVHVIDSVLVPPS